FEDLGIDLKDEKAHEHVQGKKYVWFKVRVSITSETKFQTYIRVGILLLPNIEI
ncbi:542_t:CDS:1, partial [Cetraspora pellucida]